MLYLARQVGLCRLRAQGRAGLVRSELPLALCGVWVATDDGADRLHFRQGERQALRVAIWQAARAWTFENLTRFGAFSLTQQLQDLRRDLVPRLDLPLATRQPGMQAGGFEGPSRLELRDPHLDAPLAAVHVGLRVENALELLDPLEIGRHVHAEAARSFAQILNSSSGLVHAPRDERQTCKLRSLLPGPDVGLTTIILSAQESGVGSGPRARQQPLQKTFSIV